VRWRGGSLQKRGLSGASKERRGAGDLLGLMPVPSGSYLRVLRGYASSSRFHTSLVKELPTTRRVRMIERSRSTPLPGLAKHRRRRGLTQRELGELAGVAHTTVQKLESLSRGAYPRTLRKLAQALGVETGDLVGGEPR
jgi:HTH-type transcriptional regulator, competence development regulator